VSAARAGALCDGALVVLAFVLPLSIAASEITLGVVLLSWLATRPWARPTTRAWRLLAVTTAVLAATWLLASATASDPWASLVKARKLWSIALVLVVADRLRGEARRGDRLAAAALLGGVASALHGLAGYAADRLSRTILFHRLAGVFSTAMTTGNVFATLATAALGEGLARRRGRGVRRAALAGAALLVVALLATLTRSAWLAFLAGAAVLLARARPRLLLALAAVVAAVVAFGPTEVRLRALSVVDPAHTGNAGRISLWKSGAAALADHPWTGVGLADHYALIEQYRRSDATFHAGHFHNNLIQVAVSTGLVGLAAYLVWMGWVGLLLARAARAGSWRAMVGLAVWVSFQVHGMFDWSFGDAEVANQFFLWVGLGLAASDAAGAGGPADAAGAPGAGPVEASPHGGTAPGRGPAGEPPPGA
jgi:O-antigen ligase